MRVAIAIYKLTSVCEFRVVRSLFGVHKTSVHRFVHRFCQALAKIKAMYIQMPNNEEAINIAEINFQKTGFPQVYGAIDGCHIAVRAPSHCSRDFLNRKRFHSMVLQAVADNQYRFRDVSIQCPGSEHDASVLRKSNLNHHSASLPIVMHKTCTLKAYV
uniref:Putative nuclease HARBI1 n=1 Tax=Phallusia mammillata TaxID=59560 RepID=A0A6F9DEI6_9ASCI|nr:putative nuclease HARBI1 [Phallusia mammillata]